MYGEEQIFFLKNKKYLLEGETIEDRINDIVEVVRKYESKYSDGLADRIKMLIENQILSLSTPQWANMGRKKVGGTVPLPVSCNIISYPDSISGIYYAHGESAMLSKLGAGVGASFLNVSQKGTVISEGFYTNPKADWIEDFVSTTQKISQGAQRRGYGVPFISIDDSEFYEILKRTDKTNPNSSDPLVENNLGIVLPIGFRQRMKDGDREARKRFLLVLEERKEIGKIYIADMENMNKNTCEAYTILNHTVDSTNICTEVLTPSYEDKTFACVIASINATKWDWISKNLQAIRDSIMFLDIVVEEYIRLTEGIPFMEKARRSAIEKRDIGLGLLGFHELLQMNNMSFGGLESKMLNIEIFKTIREQAEITTKEMAEKLGSPKMCQDARLIRRNVSLMMVAPNKSTSFICGNTTPGIEPNRSNTFVKLLAGIQSVVKNKYLKKLLKEKGKDNPEVWDDIVNRLGSVQHLDFLTEEEKAVFKTASEISPKDIINLASDRQKYIDMSQSLNLFNRPNYTMKDIYDIHMYAFEKDIKTLYYYYSQAHSAFEEDGGKWDTCESCAD